MEVLGGQRLLGTRGGGCFISSSEATEIPEIPSHVTYPRPHLCLGVFSSCETGCTERLFIKE